MRDRGRAGYRERWREGEWGGKGDGKEVEKCLWRNDVKKQNFLALPNNFIAYQ